MYNPENLKDFDNNFIKSWNETFKTNHDSESIKTATIFQEFGLTTDFDSLPEDGLFDIAKGLGCGYVLVSKSEYIEHVESLIEMLKTYGNEKI